MPHEERGIRIPLDQLFAELLGKWVRGAPDVFGLPFMLPPRAIRPRARRSDRARCVLDHASRLLMITLR